MFESCLDVYLSRVMARKHCYDVVNSSSICCQCSVLHRLDLSSINKR